MKLVHGHGLAWDQSLISKVKKLADVAVADQQTETKNIDDSVDLYIPLAFSISAHWACFSQQVYTGRFH